jgi:SOS-response transcriptional repressor LexA
MYVGRRVKDARRAAGLTQLQLAEAVGITQSTISELEKGESRATKHIARIAHACNVSVEYLEGLNDSPLPSGKTSVDGFKKSALKIMRFVPEISMVQAGEWTEAGNALDISDSKLWPCPVKCSDDTFALRVEGESMSPAFPPGTIIFVDPTVMPESGKKVIAFLEDENTATFKQYFAEDGGKYLKAMNPDWPSKYVEINGNCRIIGTVVFAGTET